MVAVVRHAGRTALGLAALFGLADLWQVAVLQPASLTAAGVASLLALYLAGSFAVALVLLAAVQAVRRRDLEGTAAWVRAVLLCAGLFLVLQEVGLRALVPRSPWRPWCVVGLGLGTAALLVPARRLLGRARLAVWGAAVVGLLLVAGGVGAARGFGRPAGVPAASRIASAADPPNVVLVLIDTLRADHLSCYGYGRRTSPVLDAFAGEGVLFTRAFAQSSWTKPSTASLLTSSYPTMHQVNLEKSRLGDAALLLPEVLRQSGYETAMLSGNPWVTPEYGFDQGVDHFYSIYDERFARVTLLMMVLKRANKLVESKARAYNAVKRLVQGELSTTARDERLTAEAGRWLAARDSGVPFFLYLHYMSPHHPYDPPPPFDRAFVTDPQDPPVTFYPRKSYYFYERGEPLSSAGMADMVGRYDGDILFVDTVFGSLLARLRELGLLERTVVVVTADHGEEFYEHQNWGHGHSVYNELLHVPLLVRYPRAFAPGTRVDAPVMSVDVMPTILELAGVPAPGALAGQSLVGLGRGEPPPHEGQAYSELIYRYGSGYALQDAGGKLIETVVGPDTRRTLYDLATDPRETRNALDGRPDAPPYGARLEGLRTWASERRVDAAEAQVTDEMDKRLKALGYVN